MATQSTKIRKPLTAAEMRDPPTGMQVLPTYAGSTNFGALAQGSQPAASTLGNGTKAVSGTQTEVDAQGNTWEYVNHGDGTGEWKMTKDAQGNWVGDAREGMLREQGTSGASNPPPGAGSTYQGTPPGQDAGQTQEDALIQQIIDQQKQTATDNRAFSDNTVVPALNKQIGSSDTADALDWNSYAQQGAARDKAEATRASTVQQSKDLATKYNGQSSDMYNSFAAGQNALNAQDQAGLSKYMSETDPLMSMIQARSSDPADVNRQVGSYNTLNDIGNGSLDYAAQIYNSDPNDVRRQQESYYNDLGIGQGSLNYDSLAARAFADPQDIQAQKNALTNINEDVRVGGAQQQDALNLIKSRTGTMATPEEALLAEMARRKFENDDKSSREAVNQDLAQRGVRSGASEIAGQLADREQASQDRTLSEMGLQANAMQRARDYTNMDANQSNAIRASSQNALGLQSNLTTNMRNESFDEAYKRGEGADLASANNQRTQLSGYQLAGNQANAIRDSDDTVGMFDTNQVNNAQAANQGVRLAGSQSAAQQSNSIRSANDSQRQYEDTMAHNEAARVGTLAGDRLNGTLGTTAQDSTRNYTTETEGQKVNDTNFGRDQAPIDTAHNDAVTDYAADSDVAGMPAAIGEAAHGRRVADTGSAVGVAGQRSGTNSADDEALLEALGLKMASNSKNAALKLAAGR